MPDLTLADLLKIPPPELQRALARVPDRLLAVALSGADARMCGEVLRHVSPRRAEEVSAEVQRLGTVPSLTAATAVKNIWKKITGDESTEVDSAAPGISAVPPPKRPPSRRPSRPPTAADFKRWLLALRRHNPALKEIAEQERARILAAWLEEEKQ